MTIPPPLRIIGWIVADLVAALFGTAVFESDFGPIFRTHSPRALVNKAMIVSAVVAFLLGLAAYCIRPHESAKWIWIAGFALTGSRTAYLWFSSDSRILRQIGSDHSVVGEMLGYSIIHGGGSALGDWVTYTLLPIRMMSYSAGALLASVLRDRVLSIWRNLYPASDSAASED